MIADRVVAALEHHLARHLAQDGGHLPLHVPHPRLAGVAAHELLERVLGEGDVLLRQAVRLDLLGDEVALRDLDLLPLGVAGQADHLQAVLQGLGDGVEHVGGGDEEDRGEVELDVEVVVGEGVVLLRVQDLEEGGRGVAPEVHGHLVHLVEQEDGVARARLLHHLDDLAGEGADVGAAVAADLGLVAHAAEGEPHELAVRGSGRSSGRARSCRPRGGPRSRGWGPSGCSPAGAPRGTRRSAP